jgi:hypothetical protein
MVRLGSRAHADRAPTEHAVPAGDGAGARAAGPTIKPSIPFDRTMILLSFAFAAAWTVSSAMAAHLPRILEAFGATSAQAVFAGMMIGPAQVAARVLEASTLSRFSSRFQLFASATNKLAFERSAVRSVTERHGVNEILDAAGEAFLLLLVSRPPVSISTARRTRFRTIEIWACR